VLTLSLRAESQPRWPAFRGGDAQALAPADHPPSEFGPAKNLLWKTEIPKGQSSPCIWDDCIFLTAIDASEKLQTLCLRRTDGKLLWTQPAAAEKLERTTRPYNTPATPTPCTDGRRVYVYFGSAGLFAYDFDGHEQWHKPIPLGLVRHGSGTSPIVAAGKLVLNVDQEGMKSFLIAIDPVTGDTIWQRPRPLCFTSHTTPLYRKADDGADEIIVSGSVRLVAYDLKDGSERWSVRGLEAISICPSPTLGGGKVFATSVSLGEARLPTFDELLKQCDKNADGRISASEVTSGLAHDVFDVLDADHDGELTRQEWDQYFDLFRQAGTGLFAARLPTGNERRGDLTDSHVLWRHKKNTPVIASPLYYGGHVFIIRGGGLASCFDADTGHVLYESKRLAAPGEYFASPIAAGDGVLYACSANGTVSVIEGAFTASPKTAAKNDLGEGIEATPGIVDDTLYVRTAEHLWAFRER
jgi:outer membrane protein assembly factor BamB